MFKKKPIYIILLIIFSLLLCADIVAYSLTANASSNMSTMPDDATQMQGGFSGNMPETNDGSMPEMGDGSGDMSGSMPQTTDGSDISGTENEDATATESEAPETSDGTDMTGPGGNFDPSQMQGSFDASGMTGAPGNAATSVSGLVSFISSWWIPIGIFCVLIIAFCIFMLIRISKKRKRAADDIEEEVVTTEEPKERKPAVSGYEKRRKKRRRTIRIIIIILAILAVIVLGYIVVRGVYMAQLEKEDAAAVVSAEAVGADIDTVISGTGTLADADAQEVSVPGGVEINTYAVENGDTVAEGDVLATVDHTSVMKAIADLQDAMDALDEDIEDASADTIESTIEASVDGRVKVIYAEAGTGVADTMYDNGALMLISLDGLMAADIETDADIATGDSVTVLFADGTEETGRVASFTDGVATITVTDDGTAYGTEATVSDEDGNVLGTGTLYIHSELKVTGYSGTVAKIKCDENDEVSAGDTLMTLTDTEYTAEYQLLLETRSEYEEQMIELFKLYQDGNIYAEYAGTVSGIDEDSAAGSTLASQTGNVLASQVQTLLYQSTESFVMTLLGNNPSGTDDGTVGGYSNYAATVSGVSYSSIALKEYSTSLSITDYSDYNSLGITAEMMTTETAISPEVTTPVYMFEDGAWALYSVSDISEGDVLILTYDTSSGTDDLVWIVIASKAVTGGGNDSGYSGGSHSTSAGTTSADTTEETGETYTVSETTVMSVTPDDTMSVTITIDELDILSMAVGQEATITLDAISGQTFTGSVTDIDMSGTNSGGSTKFTAVVSLDRTEQMLAGMNAAVSITLSSTGCAVTIPVAALAESESDVFVYTSYDEENKTFGDPVSVTTGLSDGTSVEILSGVDSGDEVWYEYDDTVDVSSSVVSSSSGSGFNLMRIFGGGGRG